MCVVKRSGCPGWPIATAIAAAALHVAAGCSSDGDPPASTSSLSGQVVISGGLAGARVRIDQIDLHTGEVRLPVGETVTDGEGRFTVPIGTQNGLLLITARGGVYRDLATGALIPLDDTDEIRSLVPHAILDPQDDALVSPIGHLIEARTMARLAVQGDLTLAYEETAASFHRHFGRAAWGALHLWPLDQPALAATEPVRAAFVHAALSVLVHDIAQDAGRGPQEVTVYQLMQRWTDDVRAGTFDGNDRDARASGSGLQLGACAPVEPTCQVPAGGCTTGYCRSLCDLYSGTPRLLLASTMLKIVRDRGPGGLNQTGLDVPDLQAVVNDMSGNLDPALFDPLCLEDLDRLPPLLSFATPSPGPAAAVRGSVLLRVVAVDDTDPKPDTTLIGLWDLDGDPSNAAAIATLDTAALADGPVTLTARATDRSGNTATLERRLEIDNTPPVVALDTTGFLIDGTTWWTATDTPLLTGSITDAAPASIAAVFGGASLPGVIAGARWSIQIPPGYLDLDGTPVQIVVTDAAGNQGSVTQRIRPDLTPPDLSFAPSTVNDEATEPVTFATLVHDPQHAHTGSLIDLTTSAGCPVVTKFSYLLGATTPEYVTEAPGPNPIRYQLLVDDPGVGVVLSSTAFRIGRRTGPTTQWLLDWTPAGPGVAVGSSAHRFPVDILSDAVPSLATTEGIYDVELQATDRFGRTSTIARCFDLRLRAPPLEFEPVPIAGPQTKDHMYSIDSLDLAPGAPFDQVAARLLNNDATGASVIDQDTWNGTTATIFLTITVTPPASITVTTSFVLGNATTNAAPPLPGCSVVMTCPPPVGGPTYNSSTSSIVVTNMLPDFPVRVFEVVGDVLTTELPCIAPCPPTDTSFQFAIPPRAAGGQPARMFRVMTMIRQVIALWPRDTMHEVLPPFSDEEIAWTDAATSTTTITRLTGLVDHTPVPARTGCVKTAPLGTTCVLVATLVPYRALRSAILILSPDIRSFYFTAATATLTPATAAPFRRRDDHLSWITSEGPLPQ